MQAQPLIQLGLSIRLFLVEGVFLQIRLKLESLDSGVGKVIPEHHLTIGKSCCPEADYSAEMTFHNVTLQYVQVSRPHH